MKSTTVPLNAVAEVERSAVTPSAITDGETYVGLENITSDGALIGVTSVAAGELKSGKFRFDAGHVLYGKLRPYLAKIAAPNFAGVCSTDILPIRPGPTLDRRYLFYFLRTPQMIAQSSRLAVGVNLPRVSPEAIAQFAIPLPPIPEQRRIAAVLDAAESLRFKRSQTLAGLDALADAAFLDMFGTPQTNVHGFHEVELGEFVGVKGGKRLPKGASYSSQPTPFPYIRVTDFRSGSIDMSEIRYLPHDVQRTISKYTVDSGNVIISIAGTIGQIASIPPQLDGANLTENAAKLVQYDPEVLTTEYLASFLRSGYAQNQMAAKTGHVTIGKLALFRIESLRLLLPPIDLQQKYERSLAAIRQRKQRSVESKSKLDDLFCSLQQRAFQGKL